MTDTIFNAEAYFASIARASLFARANGFRFCTCSGISMLQEPIARFQTDSSFVVFDNTSAGSIFCKGGGWFSRRTLTIFILSRYSFGSEVSRSDALMRCRGMARLIVTRLLRDEDDFESKLIYLQTGSILVKELGEALGNELTGLYLMVDIDEPVDLSFDPEQWQE